MWYMNRGKDGDVALSTRVRVARNITGYPFPDNMTDDMAREVIDKVKGVFDGKDGWESIDFSGLPDYERASYAEGHLVSTEFAAKENNTLLIRNEEKGVYIMVLEEDHIRIQSICAGLDIEGAMKNAYEAEELIDAALPIAYNERVGYITHCPTNLGTGMRASVMLHLPAYTAAGGIRSLAFQLAKLGLTIRGMNGEGSEASASLYQISNQVTLGVGEDETAEKLGKIIGEIISRERELRGGISDERKSELGERVRRDYGILMYAGVLNTREMFDMYSEMRMASAMGLMDMPMEMLDEMMFSVMPNTVCKKHGERKNSAERDALRASDVREILNRHAK